MKSSASFDATADWTAAMPAGTFAAAAAARAGAAAQLALESLLPRYPIVAHDAAIRQFLAPERAVELGERLLSATIAADHFASGIPCPGGLLRRIRGHAWKQYVQQRADALVPIIARMLADWTIWQRIPVDWLPRELVFAGLKRRMRELGVEVIEMSGHVRPPVAGGIEGLRESCAAGCAALSDRCRRGPVAAVLYRDREPEIAVLDSSRMGEAVASPGLALGPDLVEPPAGYGVRILRAVGAQYWWWRTVRRWRTRG